jgi:butyryl-CoA dehydrogenase
MAELGLLGICLPERYGGSDAPLLDALIVIEELAKVCQPAAFNVFEANTGPARVIQLFGTEAQKQRWLPKIVAGEATMAVAISEPDAGSAATDMTTKAFRDGEGLVLSGHKRWTSGAGHAELYLVYARLTESTGSRAIGAVVVESGTPGMLIGPQERLLGFHGIGSADITFDKVLVPMSDVVVPAGGFKDLFRAFSIERLGNATMSLAIGQACLDHTASYVRDRHQFGKALAEFQLVQAAIADMLMQVEAARLLIYRAAAGAGRGSPNALEASLAKCFANEMARTVSDTAVELHGGYGYSEDFGIARYLRDARGWALGGGTPSIQRLRIASQFLGMKLDQRN